MALASFLKTKKLIGNVWEISTERCLSSLDPMKIVKYIKKEFVFKNSTKAFICFALTNFDMLVSFHFRASFKNLQVEGPSRDPTRRWGTGKVGTCLAQKFIFNFRCWGLIFGIFRHNFLYSSSTRQRFGYGNTKIFLTKLFLTN